MNILTSSKKTADTKANRQKAGHIFDSMRLSKAIMEGKKVDKFAAASAGVRVPQSTEEAWLEFNEAEDSLAGLALQAIKCGDKELLLDILDNYEDVSSYGETVSEESEDL